MTVPELAHTFATALVHDTRDDGTPFVRLTPTAPAWCRAIVRSTHQNAFPHDRLYAMIRDCAIAIDEQLAWEEDLDAIGAPEPAIYTRDLWDWAAHYPDISIIIEHLRRRAADEAQRDANAEEEASQ